VPFIIQIIIGIALQVIAALIAPKPKQEKSKFSQDIKAPQASAGMPMPVVFGSITIKQPNAIYFGGVYHVERESYSRRNSGK
jgi:putative IMPACT (imprinted ancient) family translation regulator